jgi:frataxin-like iron-binding protein CyaY
MTEEDIKKSEEKEKKEIKNTLESIKALASDDEQRQQNITLREILGGDILNAQVIRRQIWVIVLIVGITIIYIGNRYCSQKELIKIDKLTKELRDSKYKALSSSSDLTEKCRESHVLEILQNNQDSTLHIADQPPFIVNIPEE